MEIENLHGGVDGSEDKMGTLVELVHISKHGTPEQFRLDEDGGVTGLSSFEDLLEIINPLGRWNVTTLFFCSMACALLPLQALSYQFLGSTPEHWCHVKPLAESNWTRKQMVDLAIPLYSSDPNEKSCKFYNYNYSKAVEIGYEAAMENRKSISIGDGSPIYCPSRDFNTSHYKFTLVAEWDLVCERRALYSTTQSTTHIGILLGDLFFSCLMDKFGRRPVVLFCSVASLISGLGAAASPSFIIYIILKTAVTFFMMGITTGCFVHVIEMCTSSQRSSVGTTGTLPWSLGFMLVPGIACLVKPWRWLQVAYTLPLLFTSSYYWIMTESPRWLISHGRYREAVEILSRAAKVNGRAFPPSDAVIVSMKNISPPRKPTTEAKTFHPVVGHLRHLMVLLLRKEYRKKILISYFCWFASCMVYYGISLNSTNLSTDPYLYVVLGCVVELPTYFIAWFCISHLGRKLSLIICYLVSSAAVCGIAIILATLETVPFSLLMFLCLSGKIAIITSFVICFVYTSELFPTRYRPLAMGQSNVMARVGSITAPYINDILGTEILWAPSAMFAVISAIAAFLCPLLPETRGSIMAENVENKKEREDDNNIILLQRPVSV
ncbi:organic cation transporter protein-like [Macrobrachium nipponense]|uniref:organic cation transporter protein-like n=1 Tax=Macrobrachium nipponense TaxID=159736 RepID=UPI0030C7F1E1